MPRVATLGPLWMTEVLDLSKSEFGLMAFGWGLGGATASLLFVLRHARPARTDADPGDAPFRGGSDRFRTLADGLGYGGGQLRIGILVAANTTSATITQHLVSDEMRGRVMGLFPLMMGLSMLTAAPVGGMGQLVGLEAIVPTLGWITLALCTAVVLTRPQLGASMGRTTRPRQQTSCWRRRIRSGGAREPAERPGGTLHGGIDGDPGGGEVATDLVDELALPGDIVLRRTEDYGD